MERLLRPYGVVIDGKLELGLELLLVGDVIQEIRPHTGIPESFAISPAFVNAHSHLEYRGLLGRLHATDYWSWIREIRDAKLAQTMDDLREEALLAARENRATGVALIGEHSDRPVSGKAMCEAGLKGVIFQELITRSAPEMADDKVRSAVETGMAQGVEADVPAYIIPHAYQTVDEETLRHIARSSAPFSMHVAESELENQMTLSGSGAIVETYRSYGIDYQPIGKRLIPTLDDLGLVRKGAQFVHCCAITSDEVGLLAERGVTAAHCPRSNIRLGCPQAPIRHMLDSGVLVGLGLDSAASSGPIDMFAEMQAVAVDVRPEEAWNMATSMGADSLRFALPDMTVWRIEPRSTVPLIKLHVPDAYSTEELIERGTPAAVEWA